MLDFLLLHQAQVSPRGTGQDPTGGVKEAPVPTAFAPGVPLLPCQLQRTAWVRGDGQAKVRATSQVSVYCRSDPGVKTGDRLLVLDRGRITCVRCDGPAYEEAGQGGAGGIFTAATLLRVDGSVVS